MMMGIAIWCFCCPTHIHAQKRGVPGARQSHRRMNDGHKAVTAGRIFLRRLLSRIGEEPSQAPYVRSSTRQWLRISTRDIYHQKIPKRSFKMQVPVLWRHQKLLLPQYRMPHSNLFHFDNILPSKIQFSLRHRHLQTH
jgi:hypothetical protein